MYRTLGIEGLLILTVSGLTALLSSTIAWSILLGGCVYALPHILFTLMALRHVGATHSDGLLVAVVIGFIGKLVFMGIGLGLIFTQFDDVLALPLMVAMVMFYLVGLVVSGILSSGAALAAKEA